VRNAARPGVPALSLPYAHVRRTRDGARRQRLRARTAIGVSLVLLLWPPLLAEIRAGAPAIGDEVRWLTAGDLAFRLVRERAGPAAWETAWDELELRTFGNLNPPLGKLLIGAVLAAAKRSPDPVDYRWDFLASPGENLARGNAPPGELVLPVRVAISLCAIGTLVLVYLCAVKLTGAPWLSLAAPGLLFASDAFRVHAVRIYTDLPQLCLLMAAVLAFGRFLVRGGWGALVGALVLAGLSVGVKFSAAPLVAALGLLAVAMPGSVRLRLARGALAAAVPWLVFVAVNPFLYPDPFGRTLWIVSTWDQVYRGLAESPLFARQAVAGPWQGIGLVALRGALAPAFRPGAEWVFERALPALAAAAALAGWQRGRRSGLARGPGRARFLAFAGTGLAAALAGAATGLSAWICPFALGVVRTCVGGPAGRAPAPRARFGAFLLAALLASWLLTGLSLRLDWSRYYLRVLALVPIFCAAGLVALRELARPDPGAPR